LIKIKENSLIKITKLYKEDKIEKTNLFVKTGKALFKPDPLTEGSSFEVNTDTLSTGVRGTEFAVAADNDESAVAVKEGSVKVKKNVEIESLGELKNERPDVASEIETSVNEESDVTPNKKYVVKNAEIAKLKSKLNYKIKDMLSFISSNRGSNDKIDEYIKSNKPGILSDVKELKVIGIISAVTDLEFDKVFHLNEFKDIKKINNQIKNKLEQNTKEIKDLKNIKKDAKDKLKKIFK